MQENDIHFGFPDEDDYMRAYVDLEQIPRKGDILRIFDFDGLRFEEGQKVWDKFVESTPDYNFYSSTPSYEVLSVTWELQQDRSSVSIKTKRLLPQNTLH